MHDYLNDYMKSELTFEPYYLNNYMSSQFQNIIPKAPSKTTLEERIAKLEHELQEIKDKLNTENKQRIKIQ